MSVAAASLIHFGPDNCFRIPVLEDAGFSVVECLGINDLHAHLTGFQPLDAVAMGNTQDVRLGSVISLVRATSTAPLILFESFDEERPADEDDEFDLVIPVCAMPYQWLKDIDNLIHLSRKIRERSQALRATSEALRGDSSALVEKVRIELERSRREIQRAKDFASGRLPKLHEE
jgi:hypothetical protein